MRVISIIQNKGGVGKSTVASNLACAISQQHPEKKTLVVDMDAQGNQAVNFGIRPEDINDTIYDVLVHKKEIRKTAITLKENLDLLSSNDDMNYFEEDTLTETKDIFKQALVLKKALSKVEHYYDYVLIDSPPELKLISTVILMATDDIYIPFEPDFYNAQGLMKLVEKIELLKKECLIEPRINGVIAIKVRKNTVLHRGMLDQVGKYCRSKGIELMKTQIAHSVKYGEVVASEGKPMVWCNPNADHSRVYFRLMKEVLKCGQRTKTSVPY